jgi:hypothetical protein
MDSSTKPGLLRRFRSFAAEKFPVLRKLSRLERRFRLMGKPTAQIFEEIYQKDAWGNYESVSGSGSSLDQTAAVRAALPALINELGIRSMLDVPCGDFFWMNTLDLDVDYTGGDIVAPLIERNKAKFGSPRRHFARLDLTTDQLPKKDLILCRDCLPHLTNAEVRKAIAGFKRSGSTYLLTTQFDGRTKNVDGATGMWRAINFELAPWSFGPPLRVIDEQCPEEGYTDKRLALWKISELPEMK